MRRPLSEFAGPNACFADVSSHHAALLSRVSMFVSDSTVKLASFRSAVRQFRNHESGAKDMIDTVFHVLDLDADATMGVVREIAGLFDGDGEKEKQGAVLEALNGFRVEVCTHSVSVLPADVVQQREKFPALNIPTGHGSDWAGITSGKILNAKRVTQTGRGGSSRQVWDRVEAAAASHPANRPSHTAPSVGLNGRHVPGSGVPSSTSAFPSLGANAAGPARSTTPHSTAWSSGGAGSNSKTAPALTGPIIRSVNYPVPVPAKTKTPSQTAFPSLPTNNGKMTAADRQALFNKPNVREESIKRITGQAAAAPPPVSSWGSVANGVEAMRVVDGESEPEMADDRPTGKKKGKGKQLLFTVSARPG